MSKHHPGHPTYDHLVGIALTIPGVKKVLDIPIIAFFTWLAFRRGKNDAQRAANRQSYGHVISCALLFGQKLILVAQRE